MILSSGRKTPSRPGAGAWRLLVLLALSTIHPQISSAYTIIFATGPITIGAGSPDNARADITMSGTSLTVTLMNLLLDPNGITSAISGVEIDFNNLSGAATASISSAAATTFDISSTGAISNVTNVTTTHWLAETNVSDSTAGYSSSTVALCVTCRNLTGASPPDELVIGGPATNNPSPYGYGGANNSITNQHSPYILGSSSTFNYAAGTPFATADTTPTWVLNIPQLQANTTIAKVRFYFGSAYSVPSQEADATIEIAPEPGPVVMMLGGLLLIAAGAWKRRAGR